MSAEPSPLIPDFDALWDYSDPAASEAKFRALLPEIELSGDSQSQAELLTQIARALGLQRKFDEAHALLDSVEPTLTQETKRAAIRYLLERGRVFNSAGKPDEARPLFADAFELASDTGEDYYAVDAAHMLAIIEQGSTAVDWNLKAIDLAQKSSFLRTQEWLGPLYNNLGWAYHQQGAYIDALSTFRQALALEEAKGNAASVRIAQWCVARTLRSLGQYEDALTMQQALLAVHGGSDPSGFTEEEIGECLLALDQPDAARPYFARAYQVLSQDEWLIAREPERIERLRTLALRSPVSRDLVGEATDAELVEAMENNCIALFTQMADTLGGDLEHHEGFGRHLCFPGNPMFKGVWRTRLTAATADATIVQNIDWFRGNGAPFFFWWTDANTAPQDFGHRLIAHGFASWDTEDLLDPSQPSVEQGAPVMIADMHRFDESLLARVPPAFEIRQIANDDELLAFRHVFQTTYQTPDWAAQAWVDATRHAGIGQTPWRIYVGWLDGEPVATNIVVDGGGISSVWGVATLPETQRRGIGAAITVGPLLDSRAQGFRYAGLFATELGAPVYERIGFRHTGTRINRYLWRNQG